MSRALLAAVGDPTGVQAVDWAALSPVLGPAAGMIAVLAVQAVLGLRPPTGRSRTLLDALALTGLAAGAVALAATGGRTRRTFCVEGTDPADALCSYVTGAPTVTLQALVLGAALISLLLALDGPGARARGEHHALLLAATTGAVALAGARDLATLVIALETVSLPVVALVALRRDGIGGQAAVKLLMVSVVSLGLLLLGIGLVYAGTGTVHLAALADGGAEHQGLLVLGAALVIGGLAYKLSAAPFGWWTPDVYAGAPLPITVFLTSVSKIAGLAALVIVLAVGLPGVAATWTLLLGVLAAVAMTAGNVVALRQRTAVRLLAWSTIAQAGWVLLPLAGARADLPAAVEASVGYLLAYVVASLAAFTVVVLVTRHHRSGAAHLLTDYRGLVRREPVAAAALGFALLCLAGLPPGVMGLVAKVVVLQPVVDAGLWWLAAVAAVNVAIGVAYYLRWIALMFAAPAPGSQPLTWSVTNGEGVALGASAGACVVLSVLPHLVAAPLGLG